MSSPVSITVVRPFETVDQFIDEDAWTVGRSELVLIGHDAPPERTIVAFDITLRDGETLVRGEGWAAGPVEPANGRAGGFKVRLRKLEGNSKSVLKRALERARAVAENAPSKTGTTEAGPQVRGNVVSIARPPAEKSGIRHHPHPPVAAPVNREELLARLRERLRGPARAEERDLEKAAG